MNSALDVLRERGFLQDCSDEEALRKALETPLTFYSGFDPTGASLHIGHLTSIMAMRILQQHGHRPIALVGGGTARIGDPSGKTAARPILSGEEIDANASGLRTQLSRYLDIDGTRGLLLDNKDWLLKLELIPFLREIGRHFSVNQMLAAEVYKSRLEGGLSFLEFNYMLLQAYDFLHLRRHEQCSLYVGGSDQWSNSLAGVDLIRRCETSRAFTLVTPLLTTASGTKMGKTERGSVWLDSNLTSPYDFYQYWINTDDRDVGRMLAIFTELSLEEVRSLASLEGAELRTAKDRLALEATAISHGRQAAEEARRASQNLFGGGEDAAPIPTFTLPASDLEGITILKLLVSSGLCDSNNSARQLVKGGGVSLDGEKVTSAESIVPAEALQQGILVRAGKKRFLRVIAQPN